ncbi:MAG: NAD-dependent epimerase/dehydratase family protein, partial [Planctomycetota bacterium]
VLQTALGQRDQISIFGTDYPTPDGTCIRDYIHVDDLATAHLLALERLADTDAIRLNLGTGRGASVREVIDVCKEVTGRPIKTVETDRREGDPPELVADPRSAAEEIGWRAEITDLRAIVESAWRWHSAHPGGFAE